MSRQRSVGDAVTLARTLLFVPGDRPGRFAKAIASGADGIVLDLEDAVAVRAKDDARTHVTDWLTGRPAAVVRINAVGTPWFDADVAALRTVGGDPGVTVMLPKASVDGVAAVVSALGEQARVLALVETAAGVMQAASICALPQVIRLAFGSIDFSTEVGVDPDDREALLQARCGLVLASVAAGIAAPLDGVTTDLTSGAPAGADAGYASRLGFTGKLCIHPSQVDPVHAALEPDPAQLDWARSIIAGSAGGAARVDGHMVDAPVVERARRLLDRREIRAASTIHGSNQ
ncbi:CoA ester lyase [Mycolicibacterium sp. 050158]|uniref:HpcH/HpaI aldolase/citrate lyase family protein n=1 Tax=Mycolicibacterium sp. 050158 TaxID=3090602 RepID=UPI00299D4D0E|nr:CoA ester lyase [Mycolicibacterium sp. 050158]MDX1888929.1 CoA ester lyase [Mycolicibacterium sp. 050158]